MSEQTEESLKDRILNETILLFNQKGLKFTMDDIAKQLCISKKTIYQIFQDKKALLSEMVDHCFDDIKVSKEEVLASAGEDTVETLKALLSALPERYKVLDLRQLYVLQEKYPQTYTKVLRRLNSDWEPTLQLMKKGMEEGRIRQVSLPVFKTMMQATLEQFFKKDILLESGITYQEALEEVVQIMVNGIVKV